MNSKRLAGAAAVAAPLAAGIVAAVKIRDARAPAGAARPADDSERFRIAHLLRRAGFGAGRAELDAAQRAGYDATLDRLLEPGDAPDAADEILARIPVANRRLDQAQRWWLARMRYTSRPLVEKMTLFWHGHFTTAISKVSNGNLQLMRGLTDVFRTHALGNFRELLEIASKDSTMSIWLDGRFNHRDSPNENYGRELMELFTLGIGNYDESDVKAAARAFTGWTFDGQHQFRFDPSDHDDGVKTFLGRTGRFNGDDILDMLAGHPATATFLAMKLARFFVADPPDPDLVARLAQTYLDNDYEIRPVLRALFKSDAFSSPAAHHSLVKSPAEFVAGTLRTLDVATDGTDLPPIMAALGQELFNPPNVAGWPGGTAWIATGTMLARHNFAGRLAAAGQSENNWWVDLRQSFGLPDRPTTEQLVTVVTDHLVDGDLTEEQRRRLYRYLDRKPAERVDLARDDTEARGILFLTMTTPVFQLN